MILEVVTELASSGLDFSRGDARELFEARGISGSMLDGYLFSLQRTIPGVEHLSYDTYRLPKEWERYTKHRAKRFTLKRLDVRDADFLIELLRDSVKYDDNLPPGVVELTAKLEADLSVLG